MQNNLFSVLLKYSIVSVIFIVFAACSENSSSASEDFDAAEVCPESDRGTFIDERDGQEYKYTTIGDQVWMAENLNYALPGDGVVELESGEQAVLVVKCYEDDGFCDVQGSLYNYYAAHYACPNGWHLPSEAEWRTLVESMGGNEVANARLRAQFGWKPINIGENPNGTDDCGFSLFPVKTYAQDTASTSYKLSVWMAQDQSMPREQLYAAFISYSKDVVFTSAGEIGASNENMTVRCLKD